MELPLTPRIAQISSPYGSKIHCREVEVRQAEREMGGSAESHTFWFSPPKYSKPMIDMWSAPERSMAFPDSLLMIAYGRPGRNIVMQEGRACCSDACDLTLYFDRKLELAGNSHKMGEIIISVVDR